MSEMADTLQPSTDLETTMLDMGRRARAASVVLSKAGKDCRTAGLNAMADAVEAATPDILAANKIDMEGAASRGLTKAMLDRLKLDEARTKSISDAVRAVSEIADPIRQEVARWTVPSGLDIARVRTPLGVIGIIYEARPNVTADAASLCIRSGNAVILRAGSESLNSSIAIAAALRAGLETAGLPIDAVQLVRTTDRAAVGHMLAGLDGSIDIIVPRGGLSLLKRVQKEARIPVIGHLEGLCHIYVDAGADLQKAVDIIVNAKMRRTGICGAAETILIDRAIADTALPVIASALMAAGCEVRGDDRAREIIEALVPTTEADWHTEYLDAIIAVRTVDGLDGALNHIETYGTGHTEAIITEDETVSEQFLAQVDAGIVMVNASTQFADGGEFGMGAEIGIATGRIHARGPVGAEQLTIFKYIVRGTGQTRP